MVAQDLFAEVLQWLALATGEDARDDVVPTLDFPMPQTPPIAMQTTERRPAERVCCSMGQALPQRLSLSLDPATLWSKPHHYRFRDETNLAERASDEGGTIGFVYTKRGGFIDVGHVRDNIDFTRYFTQSYRDVAGNPIHAGKRYLFDDTASIFLNAAQLNPKPDLAMSALIGAKLAFEYSVWHEANSYFTAEKYSAFAPEDLFSNAVGVLVGFTALFDAHTDFDVAADRALKHVLELLEPVPQATTEAATEYVKNHWWERSFGQGNTLRRHFMSSGAITPWLVSDLAIAGREAAAAELAKVIGKPRAASIQFATHYNGIFLEDRGRLLFKAPAQQDDAFDDVVGLLSGATEIRSIDLFAVSEKIRARAIADDGPSIDQPA